jgi:hypothetical protein
MTYKGFKRSGRDTKILNSLFVLITPNMIITHINKGFYVEY